MMQKPPTVIGRSVQIRLPEQELESVPARVDTGARTSAIWASDVTEMNGKLSFRLFGDESPLFTGATLITRDYHQRVVANTSGQAEVRYAVRLLTEINGRRVRATFTLANRSAQVYPILVGRNILRGRFIVDVKQGEPMLAEERERSRQLKQTLNQTDRKKS